MYTSPQRGNIWGKQYLSALNNFSPLSSESLLPGQCYFIFLQYHARRIALLTFQIDIFSRELFLTAS